MMTGCTGTPGMKAPSLKGMRQLLLVQVPSGKISTCRQRSGQMSEGYYNQVFYWVLVGFRVSFRNSAACSMMQCRCAVQCSAVQCSAVQCSLCTVQ